MEDLETHIRQSWYALLPHSLRLTIVLRSSGMLTRHLSKLLFVLMSECFVWLRLTCVRSQTQQNVKKCSCSYEINVKMARRFWRQWCSKQRFLARSNEFLRDLRAFGQQAQFLKIVTLKSKHEAQITAVQ